MKKKGRGSEEDTVKKREGFGSHGSTRAAEWKTMWQPEKAARREG